MRIGRLGWIIIIVGVVVLGSIVTIQIVGIPVQNCTTNTVFGTQFTSCKVTTYHITFTETCTTFSSGGVTSVIQCSTSGFG